LRRTYQDAQELVKLPARIRICKGAYNEPPEVAFPDKKDVDRSYVRLMERLLREGNYPGIATHDEKIIQHARQFTQREQIGSERYEFQMLYGVRRDLQQDVREGNLVYRPFSEAGFIDDLRTARGVVASAGFTLMGEAVHLHKPMLAIPVRKQLEQVLNARYLEAEGYGLAADEITSEKLGAFLERLPDLEKRVAGYASDGNRDLLSSLERGIADAVAAR